MIRFEKTLCPCVADEVTAWHVVHGWLWDVVVYPERRPIGVFFCTLLCGDGAICHFSTVPDQRIPWAVTLAAMRKGSRMIAPACGVLYATIPEDLDKLIRVAIRLGFGLTDGGYYRDGRKIALLKFYPPRPIYIKGQTANNRRQS